MARPIRTPPSKWIDEGLRALAIGGPDAVRIEALARALGVTKGGFYNHFDDRPALLYEMLETWERVGVDEVIDRVESEGGDARTKLERLFALVSSTGKLVKIELAIRNWAQRDTAVARRIRRVDNRRMDYMCSLFAALGHDEDEVAVRCLMAYSLFTGTPLIAADQSGHRRGDLVKSAQKRLLDG